MLSLRELRRAVGVLEARLSGARVQRVVQSDACTLALELYAGGPAASETSRSALVLCCRPQLARIGLRATMPRAPATPPPFAQLLRARLERARMVACRLLDEDRQAALRFDGPGGGGELVLSILGPRSNLYLLDEAGVLRGALRALESTRRTLAIGEPWRSPDTPPPAEGEDRFSSERDATLLEAIETHYAEREAAREEQDLARRLRQALKKAQAGVERKLRLVREDLRAAEEAEQLRRQGELLKTALGKVRPKATEATVTDFATGEAVHIPLDPALSPVANMERLFKRYHKALGRASRAGLQLADLEARQAAWGALAHELEALEEAGDAAALEAYAAHPEVERLLRRYAPAPPAPSEKPRPKGPFAKLPARLRPRRYRSADDLEIWVGRSDEGNDHLSTRLARGNDLFFHLEASPGSHVVLRTGGRKDPPPESVLDACELAVHFSKQKKASRASVHVVPIRNVSKPRGAKPGLVYVTGGRTLALRRDPGRLERLLASQIDADG